MDNELPDAHFGRKDVPEYDDDTPDDDEELKQTPQDVIDMLGFDPKEFEGAQDAAILTKEHVEYQARSKHGDEVCDSCENYEGDYKCKRVIGHIDPSGWCNRWTDEELAEDEFNEADHPRGQPGNAGQFGSKSFAPSKARKFEKTEAGAREGHAHHTAAAETHRAAGRRNIATPHANAAAHYLKAAEHHKNGDAQAAKESHSEAERHAREAQRREERDAGERPTKGEPKQVEPKQVEPKQVEPKQVEPKQVEPKQIEREERREEPSGETGTRERASPELIKKAISRNNPWVKSYHEKAWDHATPDMVYALASDTRVRKSNSDAGYRGAFYDSGLHAIAMGSAHKPGTSSGDLVWRHEFGHAIDFGMGVPSASNEAHIDANRDLKDFLVGVENSQPVKIEPDEVPPEIIEAITGEKISANELGTLKRERVYAAVQVLRGDFSVLKQRIPARRSSRNSQDESDLFSDFLGSMTLNRIGKGHSTEYYQQRPTRKNTEMFANYVALTQGQHGDIYKAMLHKIAPRSCKRYDGIIAEAAKKGKEEIDGRKN